MNELSKIYDIKSAVSWEDSVHILYSQFVQSAERKMNSIKEKLNQDALIVNKQIEFLENIKNGESVAHNDT